MVLKQFRIIALLAVAFLFSCSDPNINRITLTGSSTVAPLMMELGAAFEIENPEFQIDVQMGGSSRGIADARAGLADIGMISRSLTINEADLTGFTVALDGISMILHKDNSVSDLGNDEIISIYRGEITNWKELDGPDLPITVVHKAEGRSTLELFLNYFKLENPEVKPHIIVGDNQQGIRTVAGNKGAIGYVSVGSAEYDAGQGVSIRLLGVGGVEASTVAVEAGIYPLSRQLNLVTSSSTPTDKIIQFIEYAQSSAVHELIKKQYFIPLNEN